jgi:hypothetical protein
MSRDNKIRGWRNRLEFYWVPNATFTWMKARWSSLECPLLLRIRAAINHSWVHATKVGRIVGPALLRIETFHYLNPRMRNLACKTTYP